MKFGAARWISKLLVPETDRAERRPASKFAAYYYCNSALREDPVKDISSSGVYILTKERWIRGTEIFLTLQNTGPLERSRERRITTKAKVIRWGNDGVGLAFVATDDPIAREWNELVESLVEQAKLADMEDLVRMVEALAFLNQVCSGAVEVMELFRARLSSHKLRNAVEIALKAQRTVGANLAAPAKANPRIVVSILENGSAADDAWLRDLWTGLLVSSFSAEGKDNSNEGYVELFSQLTPVPIRVLTTACKAAKVRSDSGAVGSEPLKWGKDKLTSVTGSRELQLERSMQHLTGLGLIEEVIPNSGAPLPSEQISITPTCLALQLFARCNGHRGATKDFYALSREVEPVSA